MITKETGHQRCHIARDVPTGARLEMPTVIGGYNPTPKSPDDPILAPDDADALQARPAVARSASSGTR